MNRTGILVALGLAAIVGALFALFPRLDLWISGLFAGGGGAAFDARFAPSFGHLRWLATWIVVGITALPVGALVVKIVFPHRPLLIKGRAIILLLSTLILIPGLLINVVLKENWHRPRPIDVVEFGGTDKFVPWWDPRGTCEHNCSFAGGEASSAFWTLAAASLAPAPWRPLAYGAATLFGICIGLLRMAFGAHFFTDVFFAGVFVYLGIWLVHGWLYRWPAARMTDGQIDLALQRMIARARQLVWPTREGKGS